MVGADEIGISVRAPEDVALQEGEACRVMINLWRDASFTSIC